MSALFGRTTPDEQLGRRLAQGEAPAFDELYRRYAHRLAAYGTHLLGDAAAGDDVAQVALMRAYQALREGRVPDALGAWLYRIAHNAAIDSVRNRRELPTELLPEHGREPRVGEAGALTAAIAALPERQRKVFVLRELHGLRIGEAAAELGLSNAQVEQALFAARNRLAEQLVFGERLSCAAVQRLAAGPLDTRERRALKTHVRSCPACRKRLGVRGLALSLMPFPPFGWLRGAPLPVKAGVVVAAAALGAIVPRSGIHDRQPVPVAHASAPGPDVPLQIVPTVPAAVPATKAVVPHHAKAKAKANPRPVRPTAAPAPAPRVVAAAPVAAPVAPVVHTAPVVHRREKRAITSGGDGGMTVAIAGGPRTSMDGTDSGQTTTDPAVAPPAVTAATTTSTDSSDDGGGSDSSGDSGSGGGISGSSG